MKGLNLKLEGKLFGVEVDLWRILTLPVGVGILFLVFMIKIGLPGVADINDKWSKIGSNDRERKQIETKKNYLLSLDQEQLKKDIDYLNMALLQDKDSYFLVNVIKGVASDYDFRVESFAISPGEVGQAEEVNSKAKRNDLSKVTVKMVLLGTEAKYLDFIGGMERALPILQVENFNLKNRSDIIEMELTVSSFFSTEASEIKSKALSLSDLTLTKEESSLVGKLSEFKKMGKGVGEEGRLINEGKYVDYQRLNPFAN
jgi:hypothetical protein